MFYKQKAENLKLIASLVLELFRKRCMNVKLVSAILSGCHGNN